MRIRIYQVNMGRDNHRVAFFSLEELEQFRGSKKIDSKIYDRVFDGEVDGQNLEDVYKQFNISHPEGYEGRSLSVSDVVEVIDAERIESGFYFCDSVGFKSVEFDPSQTKPIKKETIKVLMVEPGKKAYEKEIGITIEDLHALLDCDCYQTMYPYRDKVVFVCDDESKIKGSKPNRALYDERGKMIDIVCGKFFICDCSTDRFKSLPDEMMEKYKKQFLLPERLYRVNDELFTIKYNPDKEKAR